MIDEKWQPAISKGRIFSSIVLPIVCVLITLMFVLRCKGGDIKAKTKYEICTESLQVSGWSFFGSVNVNAPSEGAIRECAKLAETENRQDQIEQYAKDKTMSVKQKLFFINHGIPQKVSWDSVE